MANVDLSSGLGGSSVAVVAAVCGELSGRNKVQGSVLDTGSGSSSKGHSLRPGVRHTPYVPASTHYNCLLTPQNRMASKAGESFCSCM